MYTNVPLARHASNTGTVFNQKGTGRCSCPKDHRPRLSIHYADIHMSIQAEAQDRKQAPKMFTIPGYPRSFPIVMFMQHWYPYSAMPMITMHHASYNHNHNHNHNHRGFRVQRPATCRVFGCFVQSRRRCQYYPVAAAGAASVPDSQFKNVESDASSTAASHNLLSISLTVFLCAFPSF